MKILKITLAVLLLGFLALFSYANLRTTSITEQLTPVQLISFTYGGELNEEARSAVEKKITQTPGVTSCTVNGKSKTASIIYHDTVVKESTLAGLLAKASTSVQRKELATSGGCPVHAVNASFSQLVAALDIRTR